MDYWTSRSAVFVCPPRLCSSGCFRLFQGFFLELESWVFTRANLHVSPLLCFYGPLPTLSRVFVGVCQAVPPPSLAGDLGGALGSMEHADIKFIAGGRPIYAHRAVLSCESEYFDAMFRFRCVRVLCVSPASKW